MQHSGWGPGGRAYNCQIRTRQDLCTMHLAIKFHHPMFNHLQVIVLQKKTNPQTINQALLKTSTSLCYATPVGNN